MSKSGNLHQMRKAWHERTDISPKEFWTGKQRFASPNAITQEWARAMQQAGLSVTLHSLRHTHASTLIDAGIDVLTISRRLGHGSPAITLNVYGHLLKPDNRAADAIEQALSATE